MRRDDKIHQHPLRRSPSRAAAPIRVSNKRVGRRLPDLLIENKLDGNASFPQEFLNEGPSHRRIRE